LQGRTAEQSAVYRHIVRAIALPAAFAVLAIDGTPAALAYGVVHLGILCYESLITDQARRRQGLARRVIATLAAWGREHGADGACFRVEADTMPARALYHGSGLTTELPRSHYRREPRRS